MNIKAIAVCAVAACSLPGTVFGAGSYTREFPIADCDFETRQFEREDANPYYILQPGRELHYNNFECVSKGECDEVEELVITILNKTRKFKLDIEGKMKTVTTRVLQEVETANGELVEISYNYYAQCDDNQDVYYFGENVDIYEDGEIVSHDGAWLAGNNGAKPGLILPGGAFLLGARYFQEVAPGVALDRAEHVAMNLKEETPAGSFENCVFIEETTPLEPGDLSEKTYCPGTGLLFDNELELTTIIE
ncbi:MAG: hypothetical protein H0V62_06365 [Gammaproteobacteria bacterium]|nr:hypothetical protein [Gammaproteobacteria bacterium]MBA3731554.1 hypothetical protein [Gammaproteobacteria bacterium]